MLTRKNRLLTIAAAFGAGTLFGLYALWGTGMPRAALIGGVIAAVCALLLTAKKSRAGLIACSAFLSLMMMIAMPAGRVPDEDSHLQRIWLIAQGNILPQAAGTLTEPENLLTGIDDSSTTHKMLAEVWNDPLSDRQVVSSAGFSTGVYPVISYLPQAMTLRLAQCFTNNRVVLLYASRMGGWLTCMLLLLLTLRILPRGKTLLTGIVLMPVALQEIMSASADGLTIMSAALLTACVLRLRSDQNRVNGWRLAGMTAVCLLTVCCKMIYTPLLLLPLSIRKEQWGGRGRKAAGLLLIWGVAAAAAAGWLWLCWQAYVSGQPMGSGSGVGTILPQLQGILADPLSFVKALAGTVAGGALSWIHTMLGSALSAFNLPMPLLLLAVEAAALLLCWLLTDDRKPQIPAKGFRTGSVIAAVLSLLVMLVSLYAWWNPYGSGTIEGMQGRYFLPLLLPVLLAFPAGRLLKKAEGSAFPLVLMASVSSAFIVRTLVLCIG